MSAARKRPAKVAPVEVDPAAVLEELGAAAAEATQPRARRDRLIAAAVGAGLGLRAVARATGMTHPAVKKIVVRMSAS